MLMTEKILIIILSMAVNFDNFNTDMCVYASYYIYIYFFYLAIIYTINEHKP